MKLHTSIALGIVLGYLGIQIVNIVGTYLANSVVRAVIGR